MKGELTIMGLMALFGVPERISAKCLGLMRECNWKYRILTGPEQRDMLTEVSSYSDAQEPRYGVMRWITGWEENLGRLHGRESEALVPAYIRPAQTVRLAGRYVAPSSKLFELNWYRVFRHWLFESYLDDVDYVYEFGCGSGWNLEALGKMYPGKTYVGLDWVAPSIAIVNELGALHGWKMTGVPFDFFDPWQNLGIPPNTAVLTVGALEQTGERWGPFLEYLLEQRPRRVVHVEPMVEWYKPEKPVDAVAIKFHLNRGYMRGYWLALKQLEHKGKVRIMKAHRTGFGSLYHEGYSQLIWEPVT
ncbi:MAG: class I SAM-dependent methyltransferase [Dehalococcoidia bacterium]|nr:class I SAM-dependent methyltransferase [Dehalococcoidia bacterium]